MQSYSKLKFAAAMVVAIFCTSLVSKSQEKEKPEPVKEDLTAFTIKMGHNDAFKEGVKAWIECYGTNNGEDGFNVWSRIQGEGRVYVLSSRFQNWAEFDEPPSEAGMGCYHIVQSMIMPHVESAKTVLIKGWPEVSKQASTGDMGVIWVSSFRAKLGHWKQAEDAITTISSEIKEIEGDNRGYWWKIMGGASDEPDFMAVFGYENFAAIDSDERDGVWKTIKDAKGEDRMMELHSSFYDNIEEAWSYMYRHVDDMSYEPRKVAQAKK